MVMVLGGGLLRALVLLILFFLLGCFSPQQDAPMESPSMPGTEAAFGWTVWPWVPQQQLIQRAFAFWMTLQSQKQKRQRGKGSLAQSQPCASW